MNNVEIRGEDGVHKMLRRYMNPSLNRRLQDATKAGANVVKAPLKAEVRRVSKRMARAVSVKRARKDRPATIVVFRPKLAWFRHFVIGGTKAHGPRKAKLLVWVTPQATVRSKHVRGVRPNPIVARVAERLQSRVYEAIDRDLDRE